jgi:hypothetical protein
MMCTFTCNPDVVTVATAPPTLEPTRSNENIESDNDRKYRAPSTPTRSTALHRRFLREVSMSPTPSVSRTPSPTKGCGGRESPTKEKLEVGKTGFYFSCELPLNKVSPRKGTESAKKNKEMDERGKSPSRRKDTPTPNGTIMDSLSTGSPKRAAKLLETPLRGAETTDSAEKEKGSTKKGVMKIRAPVSEKSRGRKGATPARELFGTPLRNASTPKEMSAAKTSPHKSINMARTPVSAGSRSTKKSPHAKVLFPTPLRNTKTPKKTNSARALPTKSTKMTSELVKKAVPHSALASHDTHGHGNDVREEDTSGDPRDATATSTSTDLPRPELNTITTETTNSKPVRKLSFDIGDLMAGLKARASGPHDAAAAVESAGEQNVSRTPTSLRKAAEKLGARTITAILASQLDNSDIETSVADQADSPQALIAESRSEMSVRIHEEQLDYRPLLFPRPESEIKEQEASHPIQKHTDFPESDLRVSDPPKRSFAKTSARAGTDPEIYQAMQQEMNALKSSLSNSLGISIELSAKENTFELPAMANSLLESSRQKPSTTLPRQTLVRTASDISSTSNSAHSSNSTVRASMPMDRKPPSGASAPTKPNTARWLHSRNAPTQKPRERLSATKRADVPGWQAEAVTVKQQKVPARPSSMTARSKVVTPRLKPTISSSTTATARPQINPIATRPKIPVTPVKPKPDGSGIPRSARKSVFDGPPTTKPTSTGQPPKPVTAAVHPAPSSSDAPQPHKITRPVFASATDIANRVAKWNTEDKQAATTCLPCTPTTSTPTKPKPKTDVKTSYTPKGSPATSPAKQLSRLVPPRIKSTTNLTPKRTAPKAPTTPVYPAVQRLRAPAPRTPTSRALDPNAFRTPSKEIETSLDQAIDRKIAEDKRGCGDGLEGWKWVG